MSESTAADEKELIGLDPQIDTAVSDGNMEPLERLLAEDYLYTHSHGRTDTKRSYMDAANGRENAPRRVLSEVQAEVHGDVAVTRGNLDIVKQGADPNLTMRYVRVWRKTNGKWQAISHKTVYAIDRTPQPK